MMKKQDYEKWQEELVGYSCYCALLPYCVLCDITGSGSAWEDVLLYFSRSQRLFCSIL